MTTASSTVVLRYGTGIRSYTTTGSTVHALVFRIPSVLLASVQVLELVSIIFPQRNDLSRDHAGR
jgi:hypothetical protein